MDCGGCELPHQLAAGLSRMGAQGARLRIGMADDALIQGALSDANTGTGVRDRTGSQALGCKPINACNACCIQAHARIIEHAE